MKSPVITLAELNTVYKDLIDRINVASVYNFKGEISTINDLKMLDSTSMFNDSDKSTFVTLKPGDIFELDFGDGTENTSIDSNIDFANSLNLQRHDNIVCKQTIDSTLRNTIRSNGGFSTNLDDTYYWGNYWTEVGSYMQLADPTHNGFVSTKDQTFSGVKTFNNNVIIEETLTVNGNTTGGNVTTGVLNITGGSSDVKTLSAEKIIVSGTATLKNLSGQDTTLTVKSGGSTTVNTIDGIVIGDTIDYADFQISGVVTCGNFNAESQTINATTSTSNISCINNDSATLNASRTVSCGNFDASGQSINAQKATSTIKNIYTETGVLNVSGDSIKCKTFDATDQKITANKADSTLKNISSTTATLSGVSSVTCGSLDLGNYGLTVNSTTTFSSVSNKTGSSSPSLTTSGTITCGDVSLIGTDNKTYNLLTVNSGVTFSSISGNSTNPALKTSGTITCGDFNNSTYGITTSNELTFSSISLGDKSTLSSTGQISCKDFSVSSSNISSAMTNGISFNSISNADSLSASGAIKCKDFSITGSNISSSTANQSISFKTITTGTDSTLSSTGQISCKDFKNTSGTVTVTNTSSTETTFSSITGSGTLSVTDSMSCEVLNVTDGGGTVKTSAVNLSDGDSTVPILYRKAISGLTENTEGYADSIYIGDSNSSGTSRGDLRVHGHIFANKVHNAVWNDLVDCIPVNEEAQLEYGYCYIFDGEKYHKSNKHCDPQFIGIHSDTSGMRMGERPCKTLDVAISGFVLAYVDSYKPGTPLVCGKNGRLEKATLFDKIFKPYRIIATYWKDEKEEEYGPESSRIKVNGRNWVKIK